MNIKNQDAVTKVLDMVPDLVEKFTKPKEKTEMSDAEVVDIASRRRKTVRNRNNRQAPGIK